MSVENYYVVKKKTSISLKYSLEMLFYIQAFSSFELTFLGNNA